MWIGVTERFRQFNVNASLTGAQIDDGKTKHQGVRKCLNAHYYNSTSETEHSFLIGSWAKLTRVRPPRDVDLYFILPSDVYERFQAYVGNKQSALLQEVKGVLEDTYPSTEMRGDGQVVIVRFNTINVEVVPAFLLTDGRYWICDTNNGGSYKQADPVAEVDFISSVHDANNNNLRPLIRMLKVWQRYCNVPLKSFHLELLTAEFLQQSAWRMNSFFYYDWLMRDFLQFLQGKENGYLFAPGTYELMSLGNDWKSRCDSAYERALRACQYERDDEILLAGQEWQKILAIKFLKTHSHELAY